MLNEAGKKNGEKIKKYTNRNENNERSEKNDPEGGRRFKFRPECGSVMGGGGGERCDDGSSR